MVTIAVKQTALTIERGVRSVVSVIAHRSSTSTTQTNPMSFDAEGMLLNIRIPALAFPAPMGCLTGSSCALVR
jgi:hypothetical protein